ncbi:MAG: eukaryotic-like serine/threonine-protein kinase [Blastocatellia bacterium]|nr:eukaryotic-like serine/threonine-protein kinase [Blastocatellia bacterium]
MTITTGSKLGRYEIRAKIGEGGMGAVYRARDQKLNRDVAIKVLPAAFSDDVERLHRFEQEAQAAGALNHPNILSVYDVATHDGAPYVVSELLEGETLRERLLKAPISSRKAIEYSIQIALGLAAAHEKGIVHRDVKPDNLFITKDDRVKILDFGLAKLVEAVAGNNAQTDVPTRKVRTDPGTVMGTVGYMSPEQVRGTAIDSRSDIFSFGTVLYEMLTGVRAFRGDSAVETLNAILKEEPAEFSSIDRNLAPALERVVLHCLEKSPERRFQSANDVAFALESLSGSSSSGSTATRAMGMAPIQSRNRERWIWVGVTAFLGLMILALALTYMRRDPGDTHANKFSVLPPEKSTLIAGQVPTISPDGTRLVFVITDATGRTLLYLRALDSLTAQPLVGTEGGGWPFWSPDSREIGFFAGGKLKKIDTAGGQPITLADAPIPRGGSWNKSGIIIFTPIPPGPTLRISAAGGEPRPLNTIDIAHGDYPRWSPQFLPDGRHYLFHSAGSRRPGTRVIAVGSIDSPETKTLLTNDFAGVYAAPGYLLFRREATLMAQKFDADRLELSGDSFPIAEQVGFEGITYQTLVSVSDQGVLAYQSLGAGKTQLVWFDREGKQLNVVGESGDYSDLALSPDNQRLAFYQVDTITGNPDIWLMDLASGSPSRFTFDPAVDFTPVWSPTGDKVLFATFRDGAPNLYQKAANGTGQEEALYRSSLAKIPTDWSRDGRFILCETVDPKTHFDLWMLSTSDHKWEVFLQTPFNEARASFAPNGRWIVYESDESGRKEIYVQSFPSSGAKWQVSTAGGSQPRWRSDGKELFYLGSDRKMTAVEVTTDAASFSTGATKILFETRISKGEDRAGDQYSVTSDGQRFLVNTVAQQGGNAPITVVLNWTADLKR